MWQERGKRILIILGVTSLVVLAGKAFADWRNEKKLTGEKILMPTEVLGDKIDQIGEDILKKATRVLPGAWRLEDEIKEGEQPGGGQGETSKVKGVIQIETTKVIENQTQQIIETLKSLPQEQVRQIQKLIFKDFCEEVLKE